MRKIMRNVAKSLNIGIDKILPDAFVLAIALALIALVAGLVMTDNGPLQMMVYFGEGFWNFLTFSMQMTMIVATGYMLASAPAIKRGLKRICGVPKTPIQGAVFVALVAAGLGFFNWGLGLVAGAFVARNVATNLKKVDFKMLVAVAYIGGSATGTIGLSGSEFLLVNTEGWFMQDIIGLIPLSETVFSSFGIVTAIVSFVIVVPLFSWLMHPTDEDTQPLPEEIRKAFEEQEKIELEAIQQRKPWKEMTFAEKADNNPVIVYLLCAVLAIYLIDYFAKNGFNLTINITNIMILTIAMALHGTPSNVIVAAQEGVRSAFGVALQFPIYGGIQGMMASSGMVALIAAFFVNISTAATFPFITYIYGAILNIFIPSSGGIFMVTGPSLAEAATSLSVDHAKWIFAFTYGEGISNIIQPFWAIPLLGLCKLKMKDIMGYSIVYFLAISVACLVIWGIMW